MSLDVALQSVLFYVLSCSTCNKISYRRKRKQQAKKERAEKAELEIEQPGLYRHPSPFSTNPYWEEDINLGPSLKNSKGKKDKNSDKAEEKDGWESSEKLDQDPHVLNTMNTMTRSTGNLSFDQTSSTAVNSEYSADNWNRKRYQREDEELWGHEMLETGHRFMDAIARAGSDAIARAGESVKNTGRMLEERWSTIRTGLEHDHDHDNDGDHEDRSQTVHPYLMARNPPVNDLHPPVVSTAPTHRSQTRWMLQPPPPAKIMEGKQPVTRSRSGSNGSNASRRPGDGTPLSRQVTEKLVEAKLKRGEGPEMVRSESWAKSSLSSSPRWAQREKRDSSPDSISSLESASRASASRKRRPTPLTLNSSTRKLTMTDEEDADWDSDDERTARPVLRTIASSEEDKKAEAGIEAKVDAKMSTETLVPAATKGEKGKEKDADTLEKKKDEEI